MSQILLLLFRCRAIGVEADIFRCSFLVCTSSDTPGFPFPFHISATTGSVLAGVCTCLRILAVLLNLLLTFRRLEHGVPDKPHGLMMAKLLKLLLSPSDDKECACYSSNHQSLATRRILIWQTILDFSCFSQVSGVSEFRISDYIPHS